MMRRMIAGVVTGLLVGGMSLLGTGVASAHSSVVGSVPEAGAQLEAGPARASVTFNEDLQVSYPSMTVTGPDGNLWSKGEPTVDGRTITIALGDLGPVGEYKIAYRVTSADGHPVSGKVSFTLTKQGNGTPGPKANANAKSGGDDGGGIPLWVFIAVAVVVFGGGLAFALLGGRGKKRS